MRCFNHGERDSVAICKACGRGVCPDCARATANGIACSDPCEGTLAEIAALTAHGRRAYDNSARMFGFVALVMILLGLSVVLVSRMPVMAPAGPHLTWWGVGLLVAGPLVFLLGRRFRMSGPGAPDKRGN